MKQEDFVEKLITEVKCTRNGESFYDGVRFICNLINGEHEKNNSLDFLDTLELIVRFSSLNTYKDFSDKHLGKLREITKEEHERRRCNKYEYYM